MNAFIASNLNRIWLISRVIALALVLWPLGLVAVNAQERMMIVLDGSGSMWGQIDGVPKLSIARETLRDVLPGVPETTELGLMSYGHREKGNCGDIEIIVPPALGTSAQIADAADNLRFLGKTPLSDAVKIAAEELRYTEDKATVILITDGVETCEADPCALGASLEELGVDFTAHVVGFGLSEEEGAQVSCLAENTGGLYLPAGDSGELASALEETVVAVVTQFTFVAEDQDGVQVAGEPLNWSVLNTAGEQVASAVDAQNLSTKLDEGSYSVLVEGDGISGGMEFDIAADASSQTFNVPVERVVLAATLEAPGQVTQGAEFEVIWTGPNGQNDFITIVASDARDSGFGNYAYTRHGNPAVVVALGEPGLYDVRYVHGPTDSVLAKTSIEVTAGLATLSAPASVSEGQEFEVSWTGPGNQRDYVTIVEVGADEGTYGKYFYVRNGNPGELLAPEQVGEYELRYVLDEGDITIARLPIEVTGVSATVKAPATVAAGAEFNVEWTGPNNNQDFVTIVEVGAEEGAYGTYFYTRNGNPAELVAPDATGTYEVRYVMAQSDRTLASTQLELTPVSAELSFVDVPVPGGLLRVDWTGPSNPRDYVTIVEVGAPDEDYGDYFYTRNGNPAELDLPRALGAFELRYVLGDSKRVLARLPLTLEAATANLAAPSNVDAGAVVQVKWSGPGNPNDFIEIIEKGANENARPAAEARTSQGNTLSLFAPTAPGEYEVVYRMRDNKEILARVDLTVQ